MTLDAATRARTLARFEEHRRAWDANPAVRALYADWYGRVAAALPPPAFGPRVELGSGPGFARAFIPDVELTDVVKAPWHDREVSAAALPYAERSLGALVLFDVLHHLPAPRAFFAEATRVLKPGGRIVLCEPYIGPLSYPVYKLFHDEAVDLSADPLAPASAHADGRDPFDSNQAVPTLLFDRRRGRAAFARAFPALAVRTIERLAGPSYAASGGFSRRPLLPLAPWNALRALEARWPSAVFGIVGFRILVALERGRVIPCAHARLRAARCTGKGIVGWVAVAGLLAARPARAWDDFGHMEIASVAYEALTPKARERVAALLKLNPSYENWIVGARRADRDRMAFMRAATWADAIKSDPRYGATDVQSAPTAAQNLGYPDLLRHAYWHFVDQPFSPDGTPLVPPSAPSAATQIPILRAALASAAASDDIKSYDLVWLLHLVGDVHQPLHCVSRFDKADPAGDRGGNNVRITGNSQPPVCDDPRYCPFGPPTALHAFFDDIAGSGYGTAPIEAAAAKLPRPSAKAAAIDDAGVWIAEGLALARTKIYVTPIGVGDGPFVVDAAYQAAAYDLGTRRIALAGARLANLLNGALGK